MFSRLLATLRHLPAPAAKPEWITAITAVCSGVLIARDREPFRRTVVILILVCVIVGFWTIAKVLGALPEILPYLS